MIKKAQYRLYIDETGDAVMKHVEKIDHRFLSLTGVAIESDYVKDILFNDMENLKKSFFRPHPDDPIIFHRENMVKAAFPFECLADSNIKKEFNETLLYLLKKWEYTVFSVTMDKSEYKNNQYDENPYHHCFKTLIENFVLFLHESGSIGDIMIESRGGKEDIGIKNYFERLVNKHQDFLKYLSTRQLKVKPKANNISGLQIADLFVHPSKREILIENGLLSDVRDGIFGDEIVRILQLKYYKKNGKILLPKKEKEAFKPPSDGTTIHLQINKK